ncbi:hypothetical protein L6R50_18375 [Myxococcota bacterium]|nr:hypothetical protein [Myxococcota bacterium]
MRGYLRSLDLIRHRFSRVTVCLYWLEYQDAEIRALYEDAGYPIVTNGHRDANPAFLDNLCRNLSRHEYVTTNVVGTVAFYALYLSRKMFLWGTPMYASDAGEAARAGLVAIQEGRCSILHYDRFGDRCHRAVGEAELGSEFRRSPQDLKVVLGWDRDPRVIHAERATRRVLDRVWMWGREARTVAMSTGASVVGADRRRVRWARRQGR